MNDILRMVTKQEEILRFDSFSNDDAFALGCLLVKHGKKFGPAAVEVSINGLALFRNFPNGTNQENGVWLAAKRNLVNARGRSSYGSFLEAQKQGKTLTDWKMLPETEYALCGGGFPIRLKNGALIGTACVSGLPHELDHQTLVDGISEFLGVTVE